jgi:predicted Rossmann fold flavoprotein
VNEPSADFDHDLIVIGAGAAGLFVAAEAAEAGQRVLLLEKNRRPGVKILASGGSKCNVTSTLPLRELGLWFGKREERFLRPGLHAFGPDDVRNLLAEGGVATTEMPFEKVFPDGGRAVDVLRVFMDRLEASGAALALETPARDLQVRDGGGFIIRTDTEDLRARRVAVCSGGSSYPKTGCTGDGYAWMRALGHTVRTPRPSLVPLVVEADWLRALTGIAVPDAVVRACAPSGKKLFERQRPVLFTHRGLSGPGPMDASRYVNENPEEMGHLVIDWWPDMDEERLKRDMLAAAGSVRVLNQIPEAFPRRLRAAFMHIAGIPLHRKSSELRRNERLALLRTLKNCPIPIDGDEGFPKAEVTAGGVSLDEVNPKTMESRRVPGLFLAGEILDLDGPIGGFNFQAAFSTGTIAGRAAAK